MQSTIELYFVEACYLPLDPRGCAGNEGHKETTVDQQVSNGHHGRGAERTTLSLHKSHSHTHGGSQDGL